MSFGAQLKRLRLRKGQSLQELADAVGASKAHIWELEVEKSTNPSLDLLKKLADHFEVSISQLVGEQPDEETEDQDLITLFRDLKGLSDADKKLLKGFARQMRNQKRGMNE